MPGRMIYGYSFKRLTYPIYGRVLEIPLCLVRELLQR